MRNSWWVWSPVLVYTPHVDKSLQSFHKEPALSMQGLRRTRSITSSLKEKCLSNGEG